MKPEDPKHDSEVSDNETIDALAQQIHEQQGRTGGRAEEHKAQAEKEFHEQRLGAVTPENASAEPSDS